MGGKHSKKQSGNQQYHKQNKDKGPYFQCTLCSVRFKHERELNTHRQMCLVNRRNRETFKRTQPGTRNNSNSIEGVTRTAVPNIIIVSNKRRNSQSERNYKKSDFFVNTILSFEDKVKAFRNELSHCKIDWREGCDTIEIERQLIVSQSIQGFKKINPFKELKISFKGEVSQDAGGLIREWLTVLFQHFLDENNDMFIKAETDDISYLIKPIKSNENHIPSALYESYNFIGKLIGKALLENLTVNCCFNKLIYKLILDEKVELEDLVFIDKPLYHSLIEISKMRKEEIDDLCIFFSVEYENKSGKIFAEDLITNGSSIQVTSNNLKIYIEKRIEFLIKKQKTFIGEINAGINSIIPLTLLKKFTSDEFALVLNGTPFIDIEDWKTHTTYKDYEVNDRIIVDFWNIMMTLSQEELSNFLQFCTGSSRVPIGGFNSLESNRGEKASFCITKGNYYENQSNYIRAHTCFNRLDIPDFPDKTQLETSIRFILQNETLGFGID